MHQRLSAVASLLLFAFGSWQPAFADTIAIIGTGNVGSALGQRFAQLGHTVVYGSRDPTRDDVQALVAASGPNASATTQREAAQLAEIVVLAVPWDIVESLTPALGDLSGRIVIDPTNPRTIADDGLRDYPFHDSNAERIQVLAPEAHVVKAFSTLGFYTMLDPSAANGPVSIPIAGDNAEAKRVVAELTSGIGLVPVDVGPLRYAHVIEGLHYLRYNAGQFGEARINFYLPPDLADPD
ncbi:MAG TPA: NADPH-dependent F420 reductase [Gammaproteobacteria bacterium]